MTLKQAKKILGDQSNSMTDASIEALLAQFYALAEIVADRVVEAGSNNKAKGIEIDLLGGHNGSK